jgi:hypothetical protein
MPGGLEAQPTTATGMPPRGAPYRVRESSGLIGPGSAIPEYTPRQVVLPVHASSATLAENRDFLVNQVQHSIASVSNLSEGT